MVLLLLNAILRLVCLKRLVIFLTLGLWYVKASHFILFLLSLLFILWWVVLRCNWRLRLII